MTPPSDARAIVDRACAAAAVALWALSLPLPALRIGDGSTVAGIAVLARGGQALGFGLLAWLGNPALLAGALLCWMRLRVAALLLAGVGAVLALTSFAARDLAAARGVAVPELTFLVGFYAWLAAHGLLLAGCTLGLKFPRPAGKRD